MVFKDEKGNIIEQKDVWKYENVGSDLNTIYLKKPSDNYLRYLREIHCFRLVNRGQVWYNTLTNEQREELKVWYNNWLDVTTTKTIPEKLSWL